MSPSFAVTSRTLFSASGSFELIYSMASIPLSAPSYAVFNKEATSGNFVSASFKTCKTLVAVL